MRMLIIAVAAVIAIGCSHASPLAPQVPVQTQPTVITYAINIPDQILAGQLVTLHPNGVTIAPIPAQLQWNLECEYQGAPNVYWGPIAPPQAVYQLTGITVAPANVANELTCKADEWPDEYGRPYANAAPDALFTWLGRFVYVKPFEFVPYGTCPNRSAS